MAARRSCRPPSSSPSGAWLVTSLVNVEEIVPEGFALRREAGDAAGMYRPGALS
jgi:hypothetical protein